MTSENRTHKSESSDRPTAAVIRMGDLADDGDQTAVIELINLYASRLAGRMQPLAEDVRNRLIAGLKSQSHCRLFLAQVDQRIVGMALCFMGFSTFKGAPLINIHDLTVHPEFQQRGIGSQLLTKVSDYARQQKCCAVTLEVQASNPARHLYARNGFQVLDVPVDERVTLFGKLEIV